MTKGIAISQNMRGPMIQTNMTKRIAISQNMRPNRTNDSTGNGFGRKLEKFRMLFIKLFQKSA